jgi:hypothetical protein
MSKISLTLAGIISAVSINVNAQEMCWPTKESITEIIETYPEADGSCFGSLYCKRDGRLSLDEIAYSESKNIQDKKERFKQYSQVILGLRKNDTNRDGFITLVDAKKCSSQETYVPKIEEVKPKIQEKILVKIEPIPNAIVFEYMGAKQIGIKEYDLFKFEIRKGYSTRGAVFQFNQEDLKNKDIYEEAGWSNVLDRNQKPLGNVKDLGPGTYYFRARKK